MYNTQFKVKYREIEQELCSKLKDKTEKEYNENPDDEYEYTSEDVVDICHKLYIDEFISVFGAENILDDKIDLGMKHIFEKMCLNNEFNKIIEEMTQISLKVFFQNEDVDEQKLRDLKQLNMFTLFSQNIFYITHKCICQQLETGIIDNALLVQLREHSVNHLTKLWPDI
jgi:hypothetical protein